MKPIFNDDVIREWMIEQISTEENSLKEAQIAAKNHLATLKWLKLFFSLCPSKSTLLYKFFKQPKA